MFYKSSQIFSSLDRDIILDCLEKLPANSKLMLIKLQTLICLLDGQRSLKMESSYLNYRKSLHLLFIKY